MRPPGHLILPLCNDRDMRTQVRWGLADFRHRFGRPAEGMWLPEAAVNDDVLSVLADEGVRFTILALGGGLPIVVDGRQVGAIGVSGSGASVGPDGVRRVDDEAIASAAIAAG